MNFLRVCIKEHDYVKEDFFFFIMHSLLFHRFMQHFSLRKEEKKKKKKPFSLNPMTNITWIRVVARSGPSHIKG